MVATALGGGIGHGREGQDGHAALCHQVREASKGKARRSGAPVPLLVLCFLAPLVLPAKMGTSKASMHGYR